MALYDRAIISRHAGFRIETDPSPHPSPLGGERVPGGRVRGVLHGPKFLRGYIARSEHEAQAGGFASATAFGLRRLVAAFVRERKPSRLALDGAASKSASKLAHSKRCRATVRACSHADRRASICKWALRHADIERRTPVRPVRSDCPGSRTTGSRRGALCPRSIFAK